MEIYKIFINLVKYPDSQKFYKDLFNYYNQNNFANEAKAFDYLIEKRFNKNDAIDDTNSNK